MADVASRGGSRRADFFLIALGGRGFLPSSGGFTIGHPFGVIRILHTLPAGTFLDRVWVYRPVSGNLVVLTILLNGRIVTGRRFCGCVHRVVSSVGYRVEPLLETVRDPMRC